MNSRDRAVLALLFVGFATLFFEVRYEHRFAVRTAWQAWIPIAYSALAAVGCLFGMGGKRGVRTIAATVFFLGFAVGGYGLYMHTKFEPAKFEKFLFPDRTVYGAATDSEGHPIEVSLGQPLAAPMSMAGLAAVGFAVTSGLFKNGKSPRA